MALKWKINIGEKGGKIKMKEEDKNRKNIIVIIGISLLFFTAIIIMILFKSNTLTGLEKTIYEAIYDEQPNYKDPTSVMLLEAQICGDYAIIKIGAKNSYGGIVSSKYVLIDGFLVPRSDEMDDYNEDEKEQILALNYKVSSKCLTTHPDDIIFYNSKQIKKINVKLQERYK